MSYNLIIHIKIELNLYRGSGVQRVKTHFVTQYYQRKLVQRLMNMMLYVNFGQESIQCVF